MQLQDTVAIITGAASGIGRASALLFAAHESGYITGTAFVVDVGRTLH